MMYERYNGYGYGYDSWGWLFMLIMMILFFIGIIIFVRYLGGEWRKGKQSETPEEILKKRYAKGEIDKKEYQEMLKEVRG